MAKKRVDEILDKAVATDVTVIPRYDLKLPNGTVIGKDVELLLKNPILTEGMSQDKDAWEEVLAASGITTGTDSVLNLAQPNFVLRDGYQVRFQLHVNLGPMPTLNVNGTGAVPLKTIRNKPVKAGIVAGNWLTVIYSATTGNFILQGDGSEEKIRSTWQKLLTNTMNVRGW